MMFREDVRPQSDRPQRILAVASGGGHWVQLMRTISAFDGQPVSFATTMPSLRSEVAGRRFYTVPDANRRQPIAMAMLILKTLWIVLRVRPDVVISTGAAPGYMTLMFAKVLGSRTIWVDSIANVDRMSMSGRLARRFADLWLTQWPHLADSDGPYYGGAVI